MTLDLVMLWYGILTGLALWTVVAWVLWGNRAKQSKAPSLTLLAQWKPRKPKYND